MSKGFLKVFVSVLYNVKHLQKTGYKSCTFISTKYIAKAWFSLLSPSLYFKRISYSMSLFAPVILINKRVWVTI